MSTVSNAFKSFFGVAVRRQTYLNTLYLMLAFPLGLLYFIFLVVGLCTGVPLIIVWVGLLILALVTVAWYGMIAFERQMAINILHEQIPSSTRQNLSGKSIWQKFTIFIKTTVAWKGLAYLLAKFPLGILSLVVLVSLLSISLSLIAAPLYYQWTPATIELSLDGVNAFQPAWLIDTLPEALLVSLGGFFTLLVSLHLFNGLAWVSGKFAKVMLSDFSEQAAAAVAPISPEAALPSAKPSEPPTSAE